ncbi:hypothetical protein C8J56DRAFT_795522, partial [Mycena floridula]
YQTPSVGQGVHTLNITNLGSDTVAVDLIAAAAGPNTALINRTLIIDDTYPGIHYGSGWTLQNNAFEIGPLLAATPFQNTTHQASEAGATFTFSYTGTSMGVSGIFLWDQLGSFTLTSTVDNNMPTVHLFNAQTDANPEEFIHQPNFQLFATGDLPVGNHTVTLTLSNCTDQTLVIDYISYFSAFGSIATMPDLTGLTIDPTSSSSIFSTASLPSPSTTAPPSGAKKSSAAALAGGITAGVIVIVMLILVFVWYQRRKQTRAPPLPPPPMIRPFRPVPRPTPPPLPLPPSNSKHQRNFAGSVSTTVTTNESELMQEIRAMREEFSAFSRLPVYQSA